MFVHLHTHSCYSFLEGLPSPLKLAQTAASFDMPAIALTDHRGMSGTVEFIDACRSAGITPILGLELEITLPAGLPMLSQESKAGSLVLLATGMEGWSNLCRLSSLLLDNTPNSPRAMLTFEQLKENTEGLICLTGGKNSLVTRLVLLGEDRSAMTWLQQLQDLFPDRLYVEIQSVTSADLRIVDHLVNLAGRLRLPYVATNEVFFLKPEEAALQRILSAIRLNRNVNKLKEDQFIPRESYFTTPMEMEARFSRSPEAISTTREIAERCTFEFPLGVTRFPEVHGLEDRDVDQVLRIKAEEGARRLYKSIRGDILSRLNHELDIIGACGYAPLFLIMEEIIQFARQEGIPVSSRGSAASSLVAHCLGITEPDPIRLDLYFERFLNPARATPPDIDTDICSRRRDEVISFVFQRYGKGRVAMISTINRFRRRSALREVAKVHGLPTAEINSMVNTLPYHWYSSPDYNEEGQDPYASLKEQFTSPVHRDIFHYAERILGLPRHLSIHPGGMVIAPGRLTDLAPTQMAAKGVTITQFDLDSISRLGLVKIDLLGIRGLTVLGDVAEVIRPSVGKAGRGEKLAALEAIPSDDPHTAEIVRHGRTIGCFQIESPGMRSTLKEVEADSVDDLMIALALYRPGPITGGLKDAFIKRHKDQEPPDYLHPSLETVLSETYGVILYQEQVLRIAHELAGLSLSDADLLRRAMSHFDPGKQMQSIKERFIRGAHERKGVPWETGERIWELMAAFAGYGFPKAHAASYAQIAWRSAWCKAHYPAYFMAAVLANWGGYYSQRVYLTEARRMGLTLHPPLVNTALLEFSAFNMDGEAHLVMGLNQVRDLTGITRERIIRLRPFNNLPDFLARVDPRPSEAENLVRCGALDELGRIPDLLNQLKRGGWRKDQLSLFPTEGQTGEDWSTAQKAAAQTAILGTSISAHPLELVAESIADACALTTIDAAGRIGQRVRVVGMRQVWRRARISQGGYIYFLTLEDLEGMMRVIIEANVYQRYRRDLTGGGPYVIEGLVDMDSARGEAFLRAERIWKVTSAEP